MARWPRHPVVAVMAHQSDIVCSQGGDIDDTEKSIEELQGRKPTTIASAAKSVAVSVPAARRGVRAVVTIRGTIFPDEDFPCRAG